MLYGLCYISEWVSVKYRLNLWINCLWQKLCAQMLLMTLMISKQFIKYDLNFREICNVPGNWNKRGDKMPKCAKKQYSRLARQHIQLLQFDCIALYTERTCYYLYLYLIYWSCLMSGFIDIYFQSNFIKRKLASLCSYKTVQ